MNDQLAGTSQPEDESFDDFAGTDGYRLEIVEGVENTAYVTVMLYAGGRPLADFVRVRLFAGRRSDTSFICRVYLAKAALTVLNAGFRNVDVADDLSAVFMTLPELLSPYSLVAISSATPELFYEKPDGSYLRVVTGPEGFSEPLTSGELADYLGVEDRDDDEV